MKIESLNRETFNHQGYLTLPAALSDTDLAMLCKVCDQLLAEEPGPENPKFHDIERGDDRRFLRHRHQDFPALNAFVTGSRIKQLVNTLLGDKAYLFNEQFVVKGPNTGAAFAWHQDSGYVGFDHRPYLTVWIALDDTTAENGAVSLIPRDIEKENTIVEHKWDKAGKEKVGYDGIETGVLAEVPAGSIVVFSSLTLHRSGENRTEKPRRAYVVQYSPAPIVDPATGEVRNFATQI